MKKLFFSLIISFLISAPTALAEEVIHSFHADIEIALDSLMTVTETIVYDFGDEQLHGIYRDIPATFEDNSFGHSH